MLVRVHVIVVAVAFAFAVVGGVVVVVVGRRWGVVAWGCWLLWCSWWVHE